MADKVKQVVHADTQKYKQWLLQTSEKMKGLALRLSVEGIPMAEQDKELLRIATLPIIREMVADSVTSFVTGDKDLAFRLQEEVTAIYQELL